MNKKAVGSRLALLAQKLAYGEKEMVCSGPMYQSMTVEENRLILCFESGSGVEAVKKEKDGQIYCILLNYNHAAVNIPIPGEFTDQLSGERVRGELQLEAYGVSVLI